MYYVKYNFQAHIGLQILIISLLKKYWDLYKSTLYCRKKHGNLFNTLPLIIWILSKKLFSTLMITKYIFFYKSIKYNRWNWDKELNVLNHFCDYY